MARFILLNYPFFVQQNLYANEQVFNLILSLFSIGIAVGSVFCAKMSKGKLRLGLVTVGAVGLTLCGGLLIFFTNCFPVVNSHNFFDFLSIDYSYPIMLMMIGIVFFGGFFSVPLYTWLQIASSHEFRAQAVAANNIINAMFMVVAAVISAILLWIFDNTLTLYLIVALGNLPMILYLVRCYPKKFFDFSR